MVFPLISDDFDDDLMDLSLPAKWTHFQGILHCMRRLTGGEVTSRWLRRFADVDEPEEAAAELVKAGFWQETTDGWLIIRHMDVQRSPEEVKRRRAVDAAKKRRQRAAALAKSEKDSGLSPGDSRGDSPRDRGGDSGVGVGVGVGAGVGSTTKPKRETNERVRQDGPSVEASSSLPVEADHLPTVALAVVPPVAGEPCRCGFGTVASDGLCDECLDFYARNGVTVQDLPDVGGRWSS